MCGIFGIVGPQKISFTMNILPHRGPDDWGQYHSKYKNKYCTLFQSRLSIIGLGAQGHQPYRKKNGFILVYNGEIYNYQKLRDELISQFNTAFETDTDTEVLYEYLIQFGIDQTLEIINGMYAFGFLVEEKNTLYVARDNLGVKPIYYYHSADTFAFSSEIKALIEQNVYKPVLNKALLGEYFANGWVYEPDTLFADVYKVKAGNYLKVDVNANQIKTIRYWDIDSEVQGKPNLDEIIESQTVSDVPLGIYLSGGVDSSLITCSLSSENMLNLNLDLNDSESSRVKVLQGRYNLSLEKLTESHLSMEDFKKLIYFMDEPIADPAIVPAYLLAKRSRELNRVVMLSGMGGDEIDGGYSRHVIIKWLRFFKAIRHIIKIFVSVVTGKTRRDLKRLLTFLSSPSIHTYYSLTSYFSEYEISKLIRTNTWNQNYDNKLDKMVPSNLSGLKKYLYLDLKGFLASHNTIYMDKASMAASVEVRVPFLDKDLAAEYFSSIEGYIGKKRLKAQLTKVLGEDYKTVKKQGFRSPISNWLNDYDWSQVTQYFEQNRILDTDLINEWLDGKMRGNEENDMKLFAIATLYEWLNTFDVQVD